VSERAAAASFAEALAKLEEHQKLQRERATQARSSSDDGEAQTIRVSSGGEGPRVEVVSRRRADMPTPEAAATPEDEGEK
jgi:hypothetical protein